MRSTGDVVVDPAYVKRLMGQADNPFSALRFVPLDDHRRRCYSSPCGQFTRSRRRQSHLMVPRFGYWAGNRVLQLCFRPSTVSLVGTSTFVRGHYSARRASRWNTAGVVMRDDCVPPGVAGPTVLRQPTDATLKPPTPIPRTLEPESLANLYSRFPL